MLYSFPCFSLIPDLITERHLGPDGHRAGRVNLAPESWTPTSLLFLQTSLAWVKRET